MESNKPKTTCEERIAGELKDRLEQFLPDVQSWSVLKCARYLKAEGRQVERADLEELRDQVRELVQERASESVLSVARRVTYRICLSWGGPADYFELDWDPDSGVWTGGRYLFQDWFDGASRPLTTDQVEELAELFGIYPADG